jgi:hypothetical protein
MSEEQKKPPRMVPQSDLDFNMQLTNPTWGKESEIGNAAHDSLKKTYYATDANGEVEYVDNEPVVHHEDDMWSKAGFLTRDFRLSNLSKSDYEKSVWWTEFATATNLLGYKRSTAYCILQVAPTLELSQSKGGFLRDSLNTMIQKNTNTVEEPAKKSLFGVGGSKNG